MKAMIGTMNAGKIQGAKEALEKYYDSVEIEGYKAESGVSDQPVSEETLQGARQRALNTMKYAEKNGLDIDLFMGVESGLIELYDSWYIANFAVVIDKDGYESVGIGPVFPVPKQYVEEIIQTSFGQVMEKIFQENNLGTGKGGIDNITNHSVSRIDITRDAFIMALTKHVNDYWKDKENIKQMKNTKK